ncbi:hypothetical protein [Glycomyces xiaoerkulensis]|uniref:hypothetical protein n=1 Tax=Glycomyces xiaoerkulensis TaxID=2038139 RepID=UPI0012FFE492|nr:hypothetical protein [Glycomyces xiaoerkulensis]
MATTAEIKAQIQAAMEQANEAIASVTNAQTQGESAIESMSSTTQDTSSSMPGEAVGQWQEAIERLTEAMTTFQAGNTTAEQYMNSI